MNIYDFDVYIFDFDGVIINSEYYHFLSYQKALDKLNKNYSLSYDEYCKINHSCKLSFKEIFTSDYEEIYNLKNEYYNNFIENENIELINGFENFYSNLLSRGKKIYIVTDSTKAIIEKISKKFTFLKTINNIISRDDVKFKKPNSSSYLLALEKIYKSYFEGFNKDIHNDDGNNIKKVLKRVIVFEDSLRGIEAANKVFYNIISVNTNDYFYFNEIDKGNTISNYIKIDELRFCHKNIEILPFYISSKTYHKEKWLEMKKKPFVYLTSSWINEVKPKEMMSIVEKENLCNSFFSDIKKSKFGIIYLEPNDKDYFGVLIELGILASLNKTTYVIGNYKFKNEVFSMCKFLNFDYINDYNVYKNLIDIQLNESPDYINFCNKLLLLLKNNQENRGKEDNNKISKKLDYVAIFACGEGSRLYPFTKNIPKILVCLNNETILNSIIKYWEKYTESFVIVIQEKYNQLIKYYMELLKVKYEIINVKISNGEENSYTINNSLNDEKFLNKKLLITWCDIYPNSDINKTIFGDKNIIFTYKNYGRYDAKQNYLVKKKEGNVIGIYYFSKFENLKTFESNMDICDCYIDNYKEFDTYEIDDLIDIGDMEKLNLFLKNIDNKYKTRYFNKITENEQNQLVKQSTCNYGDKIINIEMNYYKYFQFFTPSRIVCSASIVARGNVTLPLESPTNVGDLNRQRCNKITENNMPRIYSYIENGFIMEKIKGKSVYQKLKELDFNDQTDLVKNIIKNVEDIHKRGEKNIENRLLLIDIDIEFNKKIYERIENVYDIINSFSFLNSVNGIKIVHDHNYIINDLYEKIKNFYIKNNTNYCTIHGDSHFSNIIISDDDKIIFIDPRGYFGNSIFYGLKEYDIGKLVYSLSGFDEINNNEKHHFNIIGKNIDVNINNNIDAFIDLFDSYNKEILLYMTILTWLGLTDYTKVNVNKCISCYYYALYLYHYYCNKENI